jgi:hypothetical protein
MGSSQAEVRASHSPRSGRSRILGRWSQGGDRGHHDRCAVSKLLFLRPENRTVVTRRVCSAEGSSATVRGAVRSSSAGFLSEAEQTAGIKADHSKKTGCASHDQTVLPEFGSARDPIEDHPEAWRSIRRPIADRPIARWRLSPGSTRKDCCP